MGVDPQSEAVGYAVHYTQEEARTREALLMAHALERAERAYENGLKDAVKWTLATRDKSTWPPDRARILYVVMRKGYADRFGSAWTRREGTGRDEYIAFVGGTHGAWGGVGEVWQLLWAPFPVPEGVVDDLSTSRKSKYVV